MGHYWTLVDVPVGEYLNSIDHQTQEEDAIRSFLPRTAEQFYVELTLSPSEIEFEDRRTAEGRSRNLMELMSFSSVAYSTVLRPHPQPCRALHPELFPMSGIRWRTC